jgi:stage IV sporulation protein FB
MLSAWQLGNWRGVPVGLHWTVLLGLPWFYYQTRSVAATAIAFAALFFLLLAHELGHAAVAVWRRVPVREIQLLFLHGLCTHDEPYDEEDDVLIAWGGVGAQLVVLFVAVGASALMAALSPIASQVAAPVFHVLIDTNLLIMVINLVPVAPLDGAKAWRAIPILRGRVRESSWATRVRGFLDHRERDRNKRLEAESERIAGDIIARLKKGKSDSPQ